MTLRGYRTPVKRLSKRVSCVTYYKVLCTGPCMKCFSVYVSCMKLGYSDEEVEVENKKERK